MYTRSLVWMSRLVMCGLFLCGVRGPQGAWADDCVLVPIDPTVMASGRNYSAADIDSCRNKPTANEKKDCYKSFLGYAQMMLGTYEQLLSSDQGEIQKIFEKAEEWCKKNQPNNAHCGVSENDDLNCARGNALNAAAVNQQDYMIYQKWVAYSQGKLRELGQL